MKCLTVVFCLTVNLIFGQQIEFYSGPNFNKAYKLNNQYPVNDTLSILPGFTFGIQNWINLKGKKMKWGVSYIYYKGEFENQWNNFLGGSSSTVSFVNQAINVNFSPISIDINQSILNLGLMLSYRFLSNNRVETFNWPGPNYHQISSPNKDIGKKIVFNFVLEYNKELITMFTPSSQVGFKIQLIQSLSRDYSLYLNSIYKTMISPQVVYKYSF